MLPSMLGTTIAGTAMPAIVRELGGFNHLSLVSQRLHAGHRALHPGLGKPGYLRGRKNVFPASIVLVMPGSAVTGAAQSTDQLIAFRTLSGIRHLGDEDHTELGHLRVGQRCRVTTVSRKYSVGLRSRGRLALRWVMGWVLV
jgi:hypothetical protein